MGWLKDKLGGFGDFLEEGGGFNLGAAAASGVGSLAQMSFDQKEASKQRDWQEKMSGSAYTRAAYDLENAGLNRILALGNPASTPSGAKASMDKPNAIETGIAAASAKAQIAQSKTQAALNNATAQLVAEQTRSATANADKDEVVKGIYKAVEPAIDSTFKAIRDGSAATAKFIDDFNAEDIFSDLPFIRSFIGNKEITHGKDQD